MRTQDYIKLLYQSEFFGGHLISNEEDSFLRLQREAETCFTQKKIEEELNDDFLGMSRINLRPFVRQNGDLYLLNQLFVKSFSPNEGSLQNLDKKLDALLELSKERKIDLPYFSLKREVNNYKANGYPVLSHSSAVKMNYAPSYRVVKKEYWQLCDVICAINKLLNTRLVVTVAIEGNSGAGKSFFATALKKFYDCNVLSTDDFFLPFEMRTKERLSEIGGNIHYERLSQALKIIKSSQDLEYYSFDCKTGKQIPKILKANRLNIVEGCYSLHPTLKKEYDLAVVLTVNKAQQQQRIFLRDGEKVFQDYLSKWIPMEQEYLKTLSLKDIPVIYLDTSNDFSL